MRTSLLLCILLGISLFLVSAKSIASKSIASKSNLAPMKVDSAKLIAENTVKLKLNFFQKIILKLFIKREIQNDNSRDDHLASTSLSLGILTWTALLFGLATASIVLLLSIPLAIAALITGRKALKQGTLKPGNAKTGRGLGIAALIIMGIFLIIGVVIVASGDLNFN